MAEVSPLPWTTIPAMMRDVATRHGELDAVVDGEVRLDFATLHAEALGVARSLEAMGIEPGDAVAIWASNGWRWIVAASGIWQRGGIVVPLASRWKAAEVGPLLTRVEARLLFVDETSAGEALLAALQSRFGVGRPGQPIAGLPQLERVVILDAEAGADSLGERSGEGEGRGVRGAGVGRADDGLGGSILAWEDFRAAGAGRKTEDDSGARPEAVAEILFTSGTTGAPKGVELCQQQLLQAYWDWSGIGGLRAGDRFLVIPPYSHGFGLNGGILACWMRGVANLPIAVFDPRAALARIARERVTVISGPPTLFATLMNHASFDARASQSLRLAFVGAAAVPTELITAMRAQMGIERVINAYGLIEVCVVSMTRSEDPAAVIASTTGKAMPGVEVRIVDGEGRDLRNGESGEVWVRSQGVMRGYLRDPAQTAETILAGGWCRTGDVGVRDEAGHIRVVDRLKDAYNCGGFSAYPAEIENQLLEWDAIAQIAVVGVPDERLGEVGHAFVITKPGHELDLDAFASWSRANLANYKVPRRVHPVDELPLNANGKVRKDVLRRWAIDGGRPGTDSRD